MENDSPRVLITYQSRTGNTKKIMEAIYSEVTVEKQIREFDRNKSISGYSLTFLGFPTENFGPGKVVSEYLKKFTKGKKIALVVTHGAPEQIPHVSDWMQKFKDAAAESNIVGFFHCQGDIDPNVVKALVNHPDPNVQMFGKAYTGPEGQPDETRIQRAREFAREVLSIP
jgi:flavodoxin